MLLFVNILLEPISKMRLSVHGSVALWLKLISAKKR
jgi:hypothetical protein